MVGRTVNFVLRVVKNLIRTCVYATREFYLRFFSYDSVAPCNRYKRTRFNLFGFAAFKNFFADAERVVYPPVSTRIILVICVCALDFVVFVKSRFGRFCRIFKLFVTGVFAGNERAFFVFTE